MDLLKKLKEKKNKLGETSTHLFNTFLVYGFFTLAILISRILIARFYGQENLGIFTYFFSLVSFVLLFTSFGLPEAITQTIVKERYKLKSVLKKYIYLIILSTLIFTVLTLIMTNYFGFNPTIHYFNYTVIAYLVVHTIFNTIYSIFRGFKKFTEASFYSLISRALFVAFIIACFILSYSITEVLFSLSISILLAAILALPKLKDMIKSSFEGTLQGNLTKADTKNEGKNIELKKFLYLSFSLFLMQVGFYSLRFLSEIIIGRIVDFQSLGLYSAHSSITNTIRLVAYVFPVVVLPMAAVSKFKMKRSIKKILMILIPFSLITLIGTYILVPILYGAEYKNLLLPFFLVISSSLLVIYSYLNSVFVGENNFSKFYLKIISIDLLLSLIINIALNIYLIKKIGIVGAPIATSITIIFKIALNTYALKKMRITRKEDD
ncbi:MAG: oligosaccharide flippase family protein [Candidatus Woesearchaeota archaeon]